MTGNVGDEGECLSRNYQIAGEGKGGISTRLFLKKTGKDILRHQYEGKPPRRGEGRREVMCISF